jgi:hypothetical protein
MIDIPIGGTVIPQSEIKKAPLLKIEVTILSINACGLIDSKRNKNDGCTILGCQEPNPNGEVFNDFIISS